MGFKWIRFGDGMVSEPFQWDSSFRGDVWAVKGLAPSNGSCTLTISTAEAREGATWGVRYQSPVHIGTLLFRADIAPCTWTRLCLGFVGGPHDVPQVRIS